jgi:hypothetical protein
MKSRNIGRAGRRDVSLLRRWPEEGSNWKRLPLISRTARRELRGAILLQLRLPASDYSARRRNFAPARWLSNRPGRPQVNSGRGRPEWDLSYEIFCAGLPEWDLSYGIFCAGLPEWEPSYGIFDTACRNGAELRDFRHGLAGMGAELRDFRHGLPGWGPSYGIFDTACRNGSRATGFSARLAGMGAELREFGQVGSELRKSVTGGKKSPRR